MIYLIDDNLSNQQEKYGCSFVKEGLYKNILEYYVGIKTHERSDFIEAKLKKAEAVFFHSTTKNLDADGNIVESTETIEKIRKFVIENEIPYVSFSWSHTSCLPIYQNNNIISMNKRIFYLNLKEFLDNYVKNNVIDLKILATGSNYKKELLIEQAEDIIKILESTHFLNIFLSNNDLKNKFSNFFTDSSSNINYKDFIEKYENKVTVFEIIKLVKEALNSIRKYGKNIYY